jgi:hypothetical protein
MLKNGALKTVPGIAKGDRVLRDREFEQASSGARTAHSHR